MRRLDEAEMASLMAAELIARLKTVATDQPLQLEHLDPVATLRAAAATLKAASGSSITIEIRSDEPIEPIRTDRLALVNAVLNLVVNARDAMPDGGTITIQLTKYRAPDIGETLAIIVADTGHGMSENVLKRAFDPYFSTKSPTDGRGLGLSSVLGFARQNGGTATIDSTPGQGTRVTLLLPTSAKH
jgi:signal transduction histidine kinase